MVVYSTQNAGLGRQEGFGAAVVVTAAPIGRFTKVSLGTQLAGLARKLI